MAIMGSVDIPFTNSSKVAKGAEQTAGKAQETANGAAQTANDALAKTNEIQKIVDAVNDAVSQAQKDTANAINQANTAVDTANKATQDAQNAINQAQGAFDNAQNALVNAGDAIDIANALSVKVDENTGDISAIVQTTSSLTSRISTTEGNVSTLQQTANSFATRISNTEGNVSSLTQTVNGLQTQVSDNKGNISTVTQLANALQTRMTDAEGNISTLTQTSKSLQSTITSVRNDLDNLGGRNLVLNSNFADGLTNWRNWGSATGTRRTTTITDLAGFTTGFYFSADSTGEWGYAQDNISVIKDETYILTAWIRVTKGTGFVEVQEGNGAFGWTRTTYDVTNMIGKWIRISHKFTAKDSFTGVYVGQATSSGFCSADVTGIKLEKGNKATDWTPAPEDQATQSQITQLANDINLRVKKGDVINQINISTEGILIDGKKVHITGQTTIDNAVIKDAMIQSISASKIVADTLSAISADLGTVYVNGDAQEFLYTNAIDTNPKTSGTHIYIRPTADGEVRATKTKTTDQYVPIRADSFVAAPTDNAYIVTDKELRVMNISKTGIYRDIRAAIFYGSGFTTTTTSAWIGTDSALHVVAKGTVEGNLNPIYRDVYASYYYGGAFVTSTTHAYIGSDGELRVQNKGFSGIWRDVRANTYYGNAVDINTGTHLYIRPSSGGEVRATVTGSTTNYVNIRANSFLPPSSTRETKDDIVEFTRSVLGDIKNGKVYTYRYKWEEPDAFKRLGVMVDETPRILHGQAGDSIELYAFSAYLWKGVQELAAVTDNHSEELNILREQNENLILKISNLEMEMANIKQKLEAA